MRRNVHTSEEATFPMWLSRCSQSSQMALSKRPVRRFDWLDARNTAKPAARSGDAPPDWSIFLISVSSARPAPDAGRAHFRPHGAVNGAWSNRVDLNIRRFQLVGQALGEADHSGLGA